MISLIKRENKSGIDFSHGTVERLFRHDGGSVRSRSLPADYFFSLLRSFIARAMGPRAAGVGSGKDSWDSVSVRFRMGISPRTMKISSHAGRGAAVRSNGLHT